MDREHYLEQARQVIAEAEHQIREGIYSCSECRHVRLDFLLDNERCRHPIVKLSSRNKNMAASKHDHLSLTEHQRSPMRIYDGPVLCGPKGELFEPKETSRLKRFLNWMFNS